MAHAGNARQADLCPEGAAFYKCAVGPFTGCCSHDPCDTGLCRDVDDCNSIPSAAPPTPSPAVSKEQITTLTVTISEVIESLTATVTVSDIVTSVVTEPAAPTTLPAVTSSPAVSTLTSDLTITSENSESSPTSNFLSIRSTVTETPVSSIPATAVTLATATATGATVTNLSKTASSWMTQTSPATPNPPTSKGSPTSTVIGGIVGGLSFLALIAILLLFCCCRKRAKLSFSVKRKSQEDEEEQERAELLRRAEEAALQRQSFLGTAISTGAQSPIRAGASDIGPSPYPRNSTAIPPQHWI